VDVVKNGTSGLQDALTKVKTDLQSVKSAAGSDLQPQVTSLQTAVDQLSTALSNPSSVGVAGVVTAAKDVATAGTALLTSLDNLKCG
jgi:capsule polysaccharide export protein KpsE/RkpR